MWINQYLRGRGDFGELSEDEKQFIKDLDSATDRKISESTLYRSVDAEAVFGDMSDTDYENLRSALNYGSDTFGKGKYADGIRSKVSDIVGRTKGKTVTEKGYMSTTKSASIAEEFGGFTGSNKPIVMRIKTNQDTRGFDARKYEAPDMPQKEVLLSRNQSYKVTNIYGKNHQIYVDVELARKKRGK